MNQPLSISTSHQHDVCDVCARTLLRGEKTEPFINGGRQYNVCELCKPHALHEGWLRAGMLPDPPAGGDRPQRRRSLFHRRRGRSERGLELQTPEGPRSLDDELSAAGWESTLYADTQQFQPAPPTPPPAPGGRARDRVREPRHVHAVPTSAEHKIAVAVDVFNASPHRRTVAGVARSLGEPAVAIAPDQSHPGVVWIVVAWELCWYRYEVDLSDPKGSARLDGQGYELHELGEHELIGNASADGNGALVLL